MQSAIYTNMHDLNGIAGWRWLLFIIDFIITIPIAIYGFIFFPDTPETSKAFYFNEKEVQLAKLRVHQRPHTKLDWSSYLRGVLGRWHWWLFSMLWILGGENESFGSNSLFAIWLQYFNYTVPHRNHYPSGCVCYRCIFDICICSLY